MAIPVDRASFSSYILRRLGAPVIQINIDPDQVDDRIDEALQKFFLFHDEASVRTYYAYQLQPIDFVNNWISLPSGFIGAVRIFPLTNIGNQDTGLFSARYQLVMNDVLYMGYQQLQNYTQLFQHLQELEQILVGEIPIQYNRIQNKLYFDSQLSDRLVPGEYLIVEAFQVVDTTTLANAWKEPWLTDYAAALVKRQWASNLSKYKNVPMPGGQVFNGDFLMEEATKEIEKLETQLREVWETPPGYLIG